MAQLEHETSTIRDELAACQVAQPPTWASEFGVPLEHYRRGEQYD